jgi:hypothetical protein
MSRFLTILALGTSLSGMALAPAQAATQPGALTAGGASLSGASVIDGTTVTAAVGAGTTQVKWVLDGHYLGTDRTAPFTWRVTGTSGSHRLKARAYTAAGKQTRSEAAFTIRGAATAPAPAPVPAPTPVPAPVPAPTSGATQQVSTSAGLRTALAAARPGTAIHLADGVYSDPAGFTVSTACTAAARCVLSGGAGAVLDGHGTSGVYGLHLTKASYWTISGITVANAAKGVVLDGSSHNTLADLDVHGIGDEGVHLRSASSANVVQGSAVHDTGLKQPGFGEGVYVGSATSNWKTYSNGLPDRSDGNVVTGNRIWATGAESVDIKEGTTGGTLSNNTFDGAGMSGTNYADSWVDLKGNGWVVSGNHGVNALVDGFQTHVAVTGWGQDNVFRGNVADSRGPGYGFNITKASSTHNEVTCDNKAPSAKSGLANTPCG